MREVGRAWTEVGNTRGGRVADGALGRSDEAVAVAELRERPLGVGDGERMMEVMGNGVELRRDWTSDTLF